MIAILLTACSQPAQQPVHVNTIYTQDVRSWFEQQKNFVVADVASVRVFRRKFDAANTPEQLKDFDVLVALAKHQCDIDVAVYNERSMHFVMSEFSGPSLPQYFKLSVCS